jgi:hypothetical protein
VETQVGGATDDADLIARSAIPQGAVYEQVAASVEAELVKVDSRRQ